jgi:uncharacterized protein with HEPN domain
MPRDEQACLFDILQALDRALDCTRSGREAFLRDAPTHDVALRSLTVMAEAVGGVSEGTRRAHPEIPWSRIADARDRVAAAESGVKFDRVWDIVRRELLPLRHPIADLVPVIRRVRD